MNADSKKRMNMILNHMQSLQKQIAIECAKYALSPAGSQMERNYRVGIDYLEGKLNQLFEEAKKMCI